MSEGQAVAHPFILCPKGLLTVGRRIALRPPALPSVITALGPFCKIGVDARHFADREADFLRSELRRLYLPPSLAADYRL